METDSYLEAASIFAKFLPEQLTAYLTNLENLLITFNRIGLRDRARNLKKRINESICCIIMRNRVRESHKAAEIETTNIDNNQQGKLV